MIQGAPKCAVCEKKTFHYIKILNVYICEHCEREMSTLHSKDIKYEYYNIILKKIWSDFLLSM